MPRKMRKAGIGEAGVTGFGHPKPEEPVNHIYRDAQQEAVAQ
jgi:hypothetical protein